MAKQKFPHLVGAKWTAQQKTMGWRHFRVVNFLINAKVLKNKRVWAAGWQTLGEIQELATAYTPKPRLSLRPFQKSSLQKSPPQE